MAPAGRVPDDATGSAVFRMVSLERDFDDVDVSVTLRVDDLVTDHRTPRRTTTARTSGCATESDRELYAVSVDRRDGTMIIKKKCPGGTDNGGTYYDLNGLVPALPSRSARGRT